MEYEGKIGRSGLCGRYLSVSPEIMRYGIKGKEIKGESRISWFAYLHKQDEGDEG